VEIRFLLGPAGSGKTHRCLAEVRDALHRDPDGSPILLLAPKQSTFQLERQLLGEGSTPGWTRLQILSFDRLARMVLSDDGPMELLDEEGRVMVLRALLRWNQPRLRLFRSSARMMGFAHELSGTLRELQRHRLGPERLDRIAAEVGAEDPTLSDKLRDLALLGRAYREWLEQHRLLDADLLPELAAERLRESEEGSAFGAVWLDGFAEMTPQEIELLAAVVRVSRSTTLAFCLDQEIREDPPWLSTWAVVGQTARRVHVRLAALQGATLSSEVLPRREGAGRFAGQPSLAHLEATWTRPVEAEGEARDRAGNVLRLVSCADFEREVEMAAREVLRHVRAGGRFRDVAVIVRALDDRDAALRRVFLRYEIPFFIDRREPLAHHPLAELTRCALRLAAFTPRHEDWFGALKTGLVGVDQDWVDAWENDALAAGLGVEVWFRPAGAGSTGVTPSKGPGWQGEVERCAAPFRTLRTALAGEPDGFGLADALRRFWSELDVQETLKAWAVADARHGGQLELQSRMHGTAWEQIEAWLSALERGFESTRMPVSEWLAIVEAGLASLTAGVIPPSQDQVMIGAIDRSRQPELRLALVLGLNEGVFPAPARGGGILGERDRDRLAALGIGLELDRRRRVGQERYLGYVACTRSGGRLVLSWSERDESGRPRNPSPFVAQVRAVFPGLSVDVEASDGIRVAMLTAEVAGRVEHRSELLPWVLAQRSATELDGLVGDALRRERVRALRREKGSSPLEEGVVELLYGRSPDISVSALESLASCPFQFFVRRGLRGRERAAFEVDRRHTGSLAHELLARFHVAVLASGRQWRQLTPGEARQLLGEVAARHLGEYGGGVFTATPEARWEAEAVVERVRDVVGVLVGWMADYGFDPLLAELEFGGGSRWQPWRVEVEDGRALRIRGKVDRVDVCRAATGTVWYVVLDYKLRRRLLDERLVRAGIDLQLAAYALALEEVVDWTSVAGGSRPELAGYCYVGIGGGAERASSRSEGWADPEPSDSPYRHRGRLRVDAAAWLDARTPGDTSGQFALKFKKDGTPSKVGDGRGEAEFDALLADVRGVIRELGARLFSGDVSVAPYRQGSRTACDQCDLRAVCRFDAWTQSFRPLR
jgi:ATP-dependent helicase/nuclease subunit B